MVCSNTETVGVFLTKSQIIIIALLTGELLRFMVKEGLNEVSVGYQEVAELVDKLTEAMASVSGKEG